MTVIGATDQLRLLNKSNYLVNEIDQESRLWGAALACQDSCDMGKAMSIGQLLNLGVRREEATLVLIL